MQTVAQGSARSEGHKFGVIQDIKVNRTEPECPEDIVARYLLRQLDGC